MKGIKRSMKYFTGGFFSYWVHLPSHLLRVWEMVGEICSEVYME